MSDESEPPEQEKPQPKSEVWLFGGTRLDHNGTRLHAWIPLPAVSDRPKELLFKPVGSYALGSNYTVQVTRDGDHATRHGTPLYLERNGDEQLRAQVETAHRAAEISWQRAVRERADKRESALDEALQPLIKLSESLPPNQRDAFLAHIIRKITKPW